MTQTRSEELLQEIGSYLAEDAEYPLEGTLLYAQIDEGVIAPSLFKDAGNRVIYKDPLNEPVCYMLLDLWRAQDPGKKRWEVIEYSIRDDRFHARYFYPTDFRSEEERWVHREDALRRYYGDKPVYYPPWKKDDTTFEL